MASIEEPAPPPRLIAAHTSVHENIYKNTEENKSGSFMRELPRQNLFSSHYHQHKNLEDRSTTKANLLRTEISRLREEMMSKINSLENEMSEHTQSRTDSYRYPSSQSVRLCDQTTQTADVSTFEKSSWERKLLDEIDGKLVKLRNEVFDKLDSMTRDGRSTSPVWNPKRKLITSTASYPPYSLNSESRDPARSFDTPPRDNYQRLFEPFRRKSPITHHFSAPSLREPPSSHQQHLEVVYNRDLYYDQQQDKQQFTTIDQFTQTAREELSRHLVDQWFPYDDLADANVRGVKGKRLLNPNKIQKIRETIFRTYPIRENENEEFIWKVICDKINAKCRGVTRTLKRKGNSSEYFTYSSDAILTSSINSGYIPRKYGKDSINYDDRCSFVSPTVTLTQHHSNVEKSQQHLSSSSDNSDAGSTIDMSTVSFKSPEKEVSRVSCFSSSIKNEIENPDTMSSMRSNQEEELEVRVIDEEDSRSDGTSSMEDNSHIGQTCSSSPIIKSIQESASVLDICDQLAEKYMDHFPQAQDTSDKKRLQGNREEFTRTLIEAMFTRSTLAHSNVTGARGKFMLDPVKIAKVRETVFRKFPADDEDEEEVIWKILTTKINTKCRGVKRLMKRKGMPAECMTNRFSKKEHSFSSDGLDRDFL